MIILFSRPVKEKLTPLKSGDKSIEKMIQTKPQSSGSFNVNKHNSTRIYKEIIANNVSVNQNNDNNQNTGNLHTDNDFNTNNVLIQALPASNNPYDIQWTKKVLKNHYDIQLDVQNDTNNGSRWKIRKINNPRKKLIRSPNSSNNNVEISDNKNFQTNSSALRNTGTRNKNYNAKKDFFIDVKVLSKQRDFNIPLKWPFNNTNDVDSNKPEMNYLVFYSLK